jgi:hypothetical protein
VTYTLKYTLDSGLANQSNWTTWRVLLRPKPTSFNSPPSFIEDLLEQLDVECNMLGYYQLPERFDVQGDETEVTITSS